MSDSQDKEAKAPIQRARWLYARGKTWATFDPADDEKLEKKWNDLGGVQWAQDTRRRIEQESSSSSQSQERAKPAERTRELSAPPSGVDAIRSALDGFLEMPERAKKQAEKTVEKASGSPSTSRSSWLRPLQRLIPGSQSEIQDTDEDDDDSSPRESKQKESADDEDKVQVNHILDPDEPESERRARVEVMEDNLFDVDLETMTLYPVFWKGVLLKVVRATWFYSSLTDGSYAPISWDDPLSQDLDRAYADAKPWLSVGSSSGESDSKSRADQGEEADKSKLWPLPSMHDKGQVSFQDAEVGRIFSEDIRGRFLSVLGGSIVVRGFDRAEQIAKDKSFSPLSNMTLPWASDREDDDRGDDASRAQEMGSSHGAKSASKRTGAAQTSSSPPSGGGADGPHHAQKSSHGDQDDRQSFAAKLVPSSDAALKPLVAIKKLFGFNQDEAADEEKRKIKQKTTENELDRQRSSSEEIDGLPDDCKDEPPELVFAIHGIGQQLTEDFEALDFVYDVERLRNLAGKNARDPAIRRLSRGRRAQFIPICWRRFVEFDDEPEQNDNFYTLGDITNSAAIPIVRNMITKVVLDVPFYLSRHRQKMITSVISELNRTYRLFCRRNPEFERKGGRVSIIGHSLGSALAADILSIQPAKVPPLEQLGVAEKGNLKKNDHLHFNVKNLFFIGSPVAFFFYLDGGQLIARSGTNRNPGDNAEFKDAVSDVAGKYGCLAAEAVYNIFNPNDPVAFQLAPTVDSAYASLIKPMPIENAAEALLRSLSLPRVSVSKIFEKYGERPFDGVGRIVREAQLLADDQGEAPANLSQEERKVMEDRKLGKQIVASSDYIQKVRKMQRLDQERRESSQSENGDAPQPRSSIHTETGTRKKSLQPERTLRQAQQKGLISEEDYTFDLDILERAERRFRALNPHGCIDFHLSASISLSGYLDMFSAHLAYWTHPDFATFILTQLFMDFSQDRQVTLVPEVQLPDLRQNQDEEEASEDSDVGGETDEETDEEEA